MQAVRRPGSPSTARRDVHLEPSAWWRAGSRGSGMPGETLLISMCAGGGYFTLMFSNPAFIFFSFLLSLNMWV